MYSTNQPCCSWQRWGMMVLAIFIPVVVFASLFGGTVVSRTVANSDSGKLLRHVVQFKFKESSTPAQVSLVVDAFRALPSKISEITDFEYGQNNSPEGFENGFTHCFLVTFASEKDRQTYLTHAAHMQFVEVLKPHLDNVQVIDYWAGK
jgi:hypothetical protein